MNKVVKAENEKIAALDFADAMEQNAQKSKKPKSLLVNVIGDIAGVLPLIKKEQNK